MKILVLCAVWLALGWIIAYQKRPMVHVMHDGDLEWTVMEAQFNSPIKYWPWRDGIYFFPFKAPLSVKKGDYLVYCHEKKGGRGGE